jgi:hypothetical protein
VLHTGRCGAASFRCVCATHSGAQATWPNPLLDVSRSPFTTGQMCRFSHDAIRVGNSVFVCNTGEGEILQLSFPSMDVQRRLRLFTAKEHINTLAAFDSQTIWAVLHNLGSVRTDLPTAATLPSCSSAQKW